jgi:predicted phage-related endonuclease
MTHTPAVEICVPKSREEWLSLRKHTVGASEASALIGVHPYTTVYKLHAQKTGAYASPLPEIKITETSISLPPMERGNFTEAESFELLRRLRPEWEIETNQIPGGKFYRDLDRGISSTPDAFVRGPEHTLGKATVQMKDVAPFIFDKSWKDADGTPQVPIHVAIQAIIDAKLSGCGWAYAAARVSGFTLDLHLFEIPLHDAVFAKICDEVERFWGMVKRGEAPTPDYARDGAIIEALHGDEDGSIVDLTGDNHLPEIAVEDARLKDEIKIAETRRKSIKAEVIDKMGAAAVAMIDGRVFATAKTVRKGAYQVAASSYRQVNIKKDKGD